MRPGFESGAAVQRTYPEQQIKLHYGVPVVETLTTPATPFSPNLPLSVSARGNHKEGLLAAGIVKSSNAFHRQPAPVSLASGNEEPPSSDARGCAPLSTESQI
jgi:hypothetical protein